MLPIESTPALGQELRIDYFRATVVCRYAVNFVNLNFYSYLERRGCCDIGAFPFYKILRKCTTSKFSVPQTRI